MSRDEIERILSPERLSGLVPPTGAITLPVQSPTAEPPVE